MGLSETAVETYRGFPIFKQADGQFWTPPLKGKSYVTLAALRNELNRYILKRKWFAESKHG